MYKADLCLRNIICLSQIQGRVIGRSPVPHEDSSRLPIPVPPWVTTAASGDQLQVLGEKRVFLASLRIRSARSRTRICMLQAQGAARGDPRERTSRKEAVGYGADERWL